MAVNTLISKVFLMLVVFLVTTVAIAWRLFELQRLVTILTFSRAVFATQREPGLLMVKPAGLLPATLRVTSRAVLAQRLLVFVVLGMAGHALL